MGIFPKVRGEHTKYVKPPPSNGWNPKKIGGICSVGSTVPPFRFQPFSFLGWWAHFSKHQNYSFSEDHVWGPKKKSIKGVIQNFKLMTHHPFCLSAPLRRLEKKTPGWSPVQLGVKNTVVRCKPIDTVDIVLGLNRIGLHQNGLRKKELPTFMYCKMKVLQLAKIAEWLGCVGQEVGLQCLHFGIPQPSSKLRFMIHPVIPVRRPFRHRLKVICSSGLLRFCSKRGLCCS